MTHESSQDLRYIIESLIFVSEGPLSYEKIKKLLPDFETELIRKAISELIEEYETSKNSFCIREIAGGYQFRTKNEYKKWISLLIAPPQTKISKAALETLAIIAYKQPIIRSEIEHIRGVDSGGVLRILLEKNLVKILGRKEIPGRPLIYVTTKQFLETFGLKDLKSLPTPKEIEDFQKPSSGDPQVKTKQQQMPLPGMGDMDIDTPNIQDAVPPAPEGEAHSVLEKEPVPIQSSPDLSGEEKKWTAFAEVQKKAPLPSPEIAPVDSENDLENPENSTSGSKTKP